ncbi:MAG TPA: hypothetical protein VJR89_19540, partial [Polyangiales bacterium]|nr:hypothetical protein [Polyangiales bacterium]
VDASALVVAEEIAPQALLLRELPRVATGQVAVARLPGAATEARGVRVGTLLSFGLVLCIALGGFWSWNARRAPAPRAPAPAPHGRLASAPAPLASLPPSAASTSLPLTAQSELPVQPAAAVTPPHRTVLLDTATGARRLRSRAVGARFDAQPAPEPSLPMGPRSRRAQDTTPTEREVPHAAESVAAQPEASAPKPSRPYRGF